MAEQPRTVDRSLSAEALSALFGFGPDALVANRAGRLSGDQRQDLLYRNVGYLARGLVMLVLAAALTAVVYPMIASGWERALWIGVCALWLALGASWLAAARGIARPHIGTATGALRRAGDPSHPAIAVDDLTLRISYRRWKRLSAAYPGRYRAYYGPARALLSIEPAPEDSEP